MTYENKTKAMVGDLFRSPTIYPIADLRFGRRISSDFDGVDDDDDDDGDDSGCGTQDVSAREERREWKEEENVFFSLGLYWL
ncbi:hypothetical protein MTR_5g043040 [Medicago truncatula]|uniref:Uncharacterized protein n=1 Tax=Medicago truncatula TaxID=3880 RepID=G7JWP0_MEDTR|nr:hypothetical protein MTR_5g043040 [Medicago truncatula]